ncbi:acyl-CoA desaturase-like isoform X1 [Centruroides sculpturatus]|uniref:acyl-CoA desaturase-like isoform X1 n=3 Tax=Centruroides sculpturatus TaxID=218467 RepID=UPI000C6E6815|nr:acyl-CoA desaturase-like isoform X1 [Centruroides sculpturatus]
MLGICGFIQYFNLKHYIYMLIMGNFCSLGITAGAHRLWCHRTYKARLPLRILLMLLNCSMLQDNIYVWCRDHRVHHKFTDTDADPYNSKRGFFFSHMGWLMVKKHPAVIEKGKTIDVSDVLTDPVVQFQIKYYVPLVILMAIIVPSLIPYYFWDVSWQECICISFCYRYIRSLHITWLVNSAAHKWGYKPYDKNISSVENAIVSYLTNGEGFHNFHHKFPWDYSTSEYGWRLNISTVFIDIMAFLGLSYDRKKVSNKLVEKFKKKYDLK